MGRTKGIAFLGTVKFLRLHRDEALTSLPPELHHYLHEHIDPSAWYAGSDMARLLASAAQLHPGTVDRALVIMGEKAVRAHADVYGELILGRGSSSSVFGIWSSQYDTGELRRIREAPNRLRFELVDFEDTSRELCLVLGGYLKGTIAMAGISDANVTKLGCRLWGDPICTWRATWNTLDR
jgi:hypothetical protein